jgi:hypothetical protein
MAFLIPRTALRGFFAILTTHRRNFFSTLEGLLRPGALASIGFIAAVELQVRPPSPPLQPGRAARRYLRTRGTPRAGPRRPGVGLAPRPQALLMPAAALILYI